MAEGYSKGRMPALQKWLTMNLAKIASALAVVGVLAGGGSAFLARSASVASASSNAPARATKVASTSAASAKPVVVTSTAPAAPTAADKFNTWNDGTGSTLLVDALGVLSQAKSDAAAQNLAALEADASALVASGNAALTGPRG